MECISTGYVLNLVLLLSFLLISPFHKKNIYISPSSFVLKILGFFFWCISIVKLNIYIITKV